MKNEELLAILSAIGCAADCFREFRQSVENAVDTGFGVEIYEFSGWRDPRLDAVRESFSALREAAGRTLAARMIERWNDESKLTPKTPENEFTHFGNDGRDLAQIISVIWTSFTTRVDELLLDAGSYNPAQWVSRQVEARANDRSLQMRLDDAFERMSRTSEIGNDLRLIGDAALGLASAPQAASVALDPHSLILNGLQAMVAASHALRLDIFEAVEENVYRGGLSEQGRIDTAANMRTLIKRVVLSRPELADFVLSDWRREFAQRSGGDLRSLEHHLVGPIESLSTAARPIALCEQAFAAWDRFQKEVLKRLALADGLGPMTAWHSSIEPLYQDAVETCSNAIEELVSNPVYDDHLVNRALKELGICEQPLPAIANSETLPAVVVNAVPKLPPSYSDPRVFARDEWIYEQRKADKTLPWILTELSAKVEEHGWAPLTSKQSIRLRLATYSAAMHLPVLEGKPGNPANIAKARAKG